MYKYMVMEILEYFYVWVWLLECVKQVPCASNRCFKYFCAALGVECWLPSTKRSVLQGIGC